MLITTFGDGRFEINGRKPSTFDVAITLRFVGRIPFHNPSAISQSCEVSRRTSANRVAKGGSLQKWQNFGK